MLSHKRKQPGSQTPGAAQKRARFAAGVGARSGGGGRGEPGPSSRSNGGGVEGDLDLDEQDRKRSQQGRKGRVVTEGYDSDESAELAIDDEDEADEADDDADEADANLSKNGAGSDDDMFAAATGSADSADDDEDGDGDASKRKRKRKGSRFLKSSEIEGQEFGATTRVGDGDEDDILSDENDEDRDYDLELEDDDDDDEEGQGGGTRARDGDDARDDDYNAQAERTPSPIDGEDPADREAADSKRQQSASLRAKAKKGMGHKLDSFNMRAELQSGRFDEDGNYVANAADPHAQHDAWLEGNYSRKKIRAAREAKRRREEDAERSGSKAGGVGGTGAVTEVECFIAMLEHMERGESVLEALQRLGRNAKKSTSKFNSAASTSSQRKPGKYAGKGEAKRRALALDSETIEDRPAQAHDMDVDPGSSSTDGRQGAASSKARADPEHKDPAIEALEQFTALSSELMSTFGQINIYDETYEGILRALRRRGAVAADFDPAAAKQRQQSNGGQGTGTATSASPARPPPSSSTDTRQFIYRWAPAYLAATQGAQATPELQTYGPFPVTELQGWAASGYFGAPGQCERILLKQVGPGDHKAAEWRSWADSGL